MVREELRCIICDKELPNLDTENVQPQDGLMFESLGHYGSTFFDPMDGNKLVICVCDACLKAKDSTSTMVWDRNYGY